MADNKSLEQLKADIAQAIQSGDDGKFNELMKDYSSRKSEIAKAEAERQRKEAEALAGKRESLASKIHEAIKPLGLDKQLLDVKAKGFTFTVNHNEDERGRLDPQGSVKVTGGVGLLVPAIKARSSSSGNGGAGKTKDEYGMSLTEVFEKFATAEDRTKLAEAEAKDAAASEKLGKSTNSNAWRIKNEVKKHAIANRLLAPAK